MQITLNQVEIETAIKEYVAGQGISQEGKAIDIQLIAGRKANGITAAIGIDETSTVKTIKQTKPKKVKKEDVQEVLEDESLFA